MIDWLVRKFFACGIVLLVVLTACQAQPPVAPSPVPLDPPQTAVPTRGTIQTPSARATRVVSPTETISPSPIPTTSNSLPVEPSSPLQATLTAPQLGKLGELAILELVLVSPVDTNQAQVQFQLPPGVTLYAGEANRTVTLEKGKPTAFRITIRLDQPAGQQFIAGGTVPLGDSPVGSWDELYLDVSEDGTTVSDTPPLLPPQDQELVTPNP